MKKITQITLIVTLISANTGYAETWRDWFQSNFYPTKIRRQILKEEYLKEVLRPAIEQKLPKILTQHPLNKEEEKIVFPFTTKDLSKEKLYSFYKGMPMMNYAAGKTGSIKKINDDFDAEVKTLAKNFTEKHLSSKEAKNLEQIQSDAHIQLHVLEVTF